MIFVTKLKALGHRAAYSIYHLASIKVLIYILVIIMLWSFGLWDAYNVINEFVTNNRVTFVRSVEIKNGTGEFLEQVPVCVLYENTLFEHIWWNDSERIKQEIKAAYPPANQLNIALWDWNWTFTRDVFKEIDFSASKNDILELTQQQYIHALKILRSVENMDQCEYARKVANDDSQVDTCTGPTDIFWADHELEILNNSLWSLFDKFSPKNTQFIKLESFSEYDICHKIDISKIMIPTNVLIGNQYPFGLTHENEFAANQTFQINKPTKVTLRFPYYALYIDDVMYSNALRHTIDIEVISRGVFDRRNVTDSEPCHGDTFPQFHAFCDDFYFIKRIQDLCKCTPFRYAYLGEQKQLNYCRSVHYKKDNCTQNVLKEMSTYMCESCLTTQNTYLHQYFDDQPFTGEQNTSFRIGFWTKDKFFTRYEETTKNTLTQIIAQVGGDLGFYTGFSIWALWKFFVFMINYIKTRQKQTISKSKISVLPSNNLELSKLQQQSNRTRNEQVKETLLKLTIKYVKEGDNQYKENVQEEKKEKILKERITRLEEVAMMLCTRVEKDAMERKKLVEKIAELKSAQRVYEEAV